MTDVLEISGISLHDLGERNNNDNSSRVKFKALNAHNVDHIQPIAPENVPKFNEYLTAEDRVDTRETFRGSGISLQTMDYLDGNSIVMRKDQQSVASEESDQEVNTQNLLNPSMGLFPPIDFKQLSVKIVSTELVKGSLSYYRMYRIEAVYRGEKRWYVNRRMKEFLKLHSRLKLKQLKRKVAQVPTFPNTLLFAFERAYDRAIQTARQMSLHNWSLRTARDEDSKKTKALELYIQQLLKVVDSGSSYLVCCFLECSAFSLAQDGKEKGKEGLALKKSGGRQFSFRCMPTHLCGIRNFSMKWLFIQNNFVAYFNSPQECRIGDVLLCDKYFKIVHGNKATGAKNGITISNGYRDLEIIATNIRQKMEWIEELEKIQSTTEYATEHPHNSFAPLRQQAYLEPFVDGNDLFSSIADAILEAKSEIYITDWWLSPALHLKRDPCSDQFRLDFLLKKKAEEGVRIYIVLYKELKIAFYNNSRYTKRYIKSLHHNISVFRNPDHTPPRGSVKWAHHEKIVCIDQTVAYIGGIDLCYGRHDTPEHRLIDYDEENLNGKIWLGQDYSNPRIRDFYDVHMPNISTIDRKLIPRMPWHDIACKTIGPVARDCARHFIQRWNFIKVSKAKESFYTPFLVPKPDFTPEELGSITKGTCHVQLLRSTGPWSNGTFPESSIHEAYLHYIDNSKHFIYIENQFFISSARESHFVENKIALAILNRILKAAKEHTKFRVYVILPLMPGFPGEVDDVQAASLRVIIQWQNKSIRFLQKRLLEANITPSNYIEFFSLRRYEKLGSKFVTEQIYVHSKLLIVDDQTAILGSANINDRSMLGVRDSEICLVINDDSKITTRLAGKDWDASSFAFNLRMRLFKEHLGFRLDDSTSNAILLDPVIESFYLDIWKRRAFENTLIYREYFHCLPDDTINTWEEYSRFQRKLQMPPDVEHLCNILGFLVLYPTRFLMEEDLSISVLSKEYYIPNDIYT